MADHWKEISDWFEQVMDLPTEQAVELLEGECNDSAVRAEVLSLLEAGRRVGETLIPSDQFREQIGFAEPPDPAPKRCGPYRLEQRIASGGMGTVWLAHRDDGRFDQTVAVKIVKRGLDTDEVVRRFRRERQLLADLEHPHIARLIDGGATLDGRPFLVMEYIDGRHIDCYCRDHELGVEDTLRLFLEVCEAVESAHTRGIVHRDLKPGNILVTESGTPKLLDFGIAKLLQEEGPEASLLTRTGQLLLTPRYAAPEQVRGEPISVATDVYALGLLLFELLTGRPAHDLQGTSQHELERVICVDDVTRPSLAVPAGQRPKLRGDLDLIVLKALSKEPERRYSRAGGLAEDLCRHLDGRPILARPDTFSHRVGKLVRRNRTLIAATLAVFLALGVGLVVALLEYGRAEDQRGIAEERRDDAEARAYEASLSAAEALFLGSRPVEARVQLDSAPPELRGWEWDYLDNMLDRSLWSVTLDGAITALDFSPDARFQAVGNATEASDRLVLLDPKNGKRIAELQFTSEKVTGLRFSPDGTRLAAGGSDGALVLYDMNSRTVLFKDSQHAGEVRQLAFSANGALLASACTEGTVLIRIAADLSVKRRFDRPHGIVAMALDFDPSGRQLAAASKQNILVFPVDPLGKIRRFPARGDVLYGIAWTDGGRSLRQAGPHNHHCLYDMVTGRLLKVHTGPVGGFKMIAISRDGLLATSMFKEGRHIEVVDTTTNAVIARLDGMQVGGHPNLVRAVTFSPDGSRLAIGTYLGTVRCWDVSGCPSVRTIESYASGVPSLAISPDGSYLATSHGKGTIRVWDPRTGIHLRTLNGHTRGCRNIAFHPERPLLASASDDGSGRLWDLSTGECLAEWQHAKGQARDAVFDGAGRRLFTAGTDGIIQVRDAATGEFLDQWTDNGNDILCLALSPDGSRLASAGGSLSPGRRVDSAIRIWDVATGEVVARLPGYPDPIRCLVWSADGKSVTVAGNGEEHRLQTFEVETGRTSGLFQATPDRVRILDLRSIDEGRRWLLSCQDETVRVFDPGGRRQMFSLHGMRGLVELVGVDRKAQLVAAPGSSEMRVFDRRSPEDALAGHVVRRLWKRYVIQDLVRAKVEADPWLNSAQRAEALRMVENLHDEPDEWLRRAQVGLRRSADGVAQALRWARAAATLKPDDPWARFFEAVGLYETERHEQALVWLEEAEARREPDAFGTLDDLVLRARILIGLGRRDEALSRFRELERNLRELDDPATALRLRLSHEYLRLEFFDELEQVRDG